MDIRRHVSKIGWAYVVFLIVSGVAQIGVVVLLNILRPLMFLTAFGGQTMLLISQLIMYGVGFPVFWLMMKQIPSWKMVEKKDLTGGQFLLAAVVCFGATYIGNIVGQGLMALTGQLTGSESINPLLQVIEDMDLGMVMLTTVIIAPIMEELMFRKFLIDRLVPLGQKTAVILSGLSFGLFHGNFYQFFYATLLGMIFAYLYSYTGKIRYNILLHMMINVVGGVFSLMLVREADQGTVFAMVFGALLGFLVIGSIIAVIVLAIVRYRKLRWFPAWEYPEQGMFLTLIKAPGVWGFFLSCGIAFLFQ
ncbi:MAG: type II CAAX endopeptidase family protein [Lachnospiraceae bacterium]|nr:type II CAAX endopeptidase family protein [Lachnospiraceae bacterium]